MKMIQFHKMVNKSAPSYLQNHVTLTESNYMLRTMGPSIYYVITKGGGGGFLL